MGDPSQFILPFDQSYLEQRIKGSEFLTIRPLWGHDPDSLFLSLLITVGWRSHSFSLTRGETEAQSHLAREKQNRHLCVGLAIQSLSDCITCSASTAHGEPSGSLGLRNCLIHISTGCSRKLLLEREGDLCLLEKWFEGWTPEVLASPQKEAGIDSIESDWVPRPVSLNAWPILNGKRW